MPTAARKTSTKATAKLTTITLPALKKGEHYAGIALVDGVPSHHLILLPGENKKCNFKAAGTWAKKQGGELPSRREQSLLFANCKEQFPDGGCYWSGEQHASDSGYAWFQAFNLGYQSLYTTNYTRRARAVRRVAI